MLYLPPDLDVKPGDVIRGWRILTATKVGRLGWWCTAEAVT